MKKTMANKTDRAAVAPKVIQGFGSDTETGYPGLDPNPYPPTDFGTNNLIVSGGGFGTTGVDLTDDPLLAALGLVVGDPMPPENNIHDLIETDGVDDLKDFNRRLRVPNDIIDEALRAKYATQISGGYPAVEPPV
jgi:hypothetical protein